MYRLLEQRRRSMALAMIIIDISGGKNEFDR